MLRIYFVILISISALIPSIKCKINTESELEEFLELVDNELATINDQKNDISWRKDAFYVEDDAGEESPEEVKLTKELQKLTKYIYDETNNLSPKLKNNPKLKEKLAHLPKLEYEALNTEDMEEFEEATTNMTLTFMTVHLCSYKDPMRCNLTLIPDVQDIIYHSNDVAEVEYYWHEWNEKNGYMAKENFAKFVKLYRKTAKANGYQKASDYWFRKFGKSEEMVKLINKIMNQLDPLFKEFHGRVRSLLRNKYGDDVVKYNFPYPQHLSEKYIGAAFRNEEKDGIELPYPEVGIPNITEAFNMKKFLPKTFYELAESFFESIGLDGLGDDFWEKNVSPKGDPSETYLFCTNKPYNSLGSDKLKMTHCPNVDYLRYMNMFETVATLHFHKEAKVQPSIFQNEPFPEFFDNLGKIFSLSASTPTYMEKAGLIPPDTFSGEQRLNRLYFMGFQEVFVLPVLYVLDKYRIDVMDKGLKTWDNCAYWDLTEKFTGAVPPVKRSNENFDIPSKLLISVDEVYSGVIIGTAFKHQVYKYFCEKTGQYEKGNSALPLDYCDLSGHPEIGENIRKAMALGSSKPWTEILATLTDGQTELSLDGFLEYYEPLLDWLKEDNSFRMVEVGWVDSNQCEK